jgi:hypothetical protein
MVNVGSSTSHNLIHLLGPLWFLFQITIIFSSGLKLLMNLIPELPKEEINLSVFKARETTGNTTGVCIKR